MRASAPRSVSRGIGLLLAVSVLAGQVGAERPVRAPRVEHRRGARFASVRIDLAPPRGFRPSDGIDRLADFLATSPGGRYTYHPRLYPRYLAHGRVLTLESDLLHSPNPQERGTARQILSLGREFRFQMTSEVPTQESHFRLLRRTLGRLGWRPGSTQDGTITWQPTTAAP